MSIVVMFVAVVFFVIGFMAGVLYEKENKELKS